MTIIRPQLGDPAPWFSATTASGQRIDIHVDAGRYLLLSFIGKPIGPEELFDPRVGELMRHRALFRDDHIILYGIINALPHERSAYATIRRPGIDFLVDVDGALAGQFGTDGKPWTFLLDPMMRVIASIPYDHPDGHGAMLEQLLATLPPPAEHAGIHLTAPVLMVPRVFDFELCEFMIDAFRRHGGKDSGYFVDRGGVTQTITDYRFKRRSDWVIDDAALAVEIRKRIVSRLVPAVRQAFGFSATRMDRYLVARYSAETKDHFFRHRDNLNAGSAHRRFAVTINLNAEAKNYGGGDLCFPEFGRDTYRPPSGGAAVFSCGLLHEVTRMERGERFAFLAFLYGEEDAQRRLTNNARLAAGERRYFGDDDRLALPEVMSTEVANDTPAREDAPKEWVPVGADITGTGPAVRWLQLGGCDFSRPFYSQAIEMAIEHQREASSRTTSLEELESLCTTPLAAPSGLVFHMSRCGSTLVSRMLAAANDTLVISEPDPINDILGPYWRGTSEAERRRALRLVLAAFGGLRRPGQSGYVVKFSSWNVWYLTSLLADLRGVPKVFVYRDPVEVLVSLMNDPPEWAALRHNTAAASMMLGVPRDLIQTMSAEEYCARFLRGILDAVLAHAGPSWLFVNYNELPDAVYERIPAHFGAAPDTERGMRMHAVTGVHSRDRFLAKPFSDDRAKKLAAATDAIRAVAGQWLAEPYAKLEALRQKQAPMKHAAS
ncbi:MAG TPA: 2OG-Fe(II) oxygenase [Magnetospirillaceae bacterium]